MSTNKVPKTPPSINEAVTIGETIKLKWDIGKKYPDSYQLIAFLNSQDGGYTNMVIGSIPVNQSNELDWNVASPIRWTDVSVGIKPGNYSISLVLIDGSVCGATGGECIDYKYQKIAESEPIPVNIIK